MFGEVLPGGEGAAIWSFLTYAGLHADWGHLGINCLGLAAFGSPRGTALRCRTLPPLFGGWRGCAARACICSFDVTPLVGASAAISAHMAGAARFAFSSGGPLHRDAGKLEAYRRPAQPLLALLQDSRVVIFVAVWFGVNLVFGLLGSDYRPLLRRDRLGRACRRFRSRLAALSAVRSDPGCRADRPGLTATLYCSAY